MEDEQTSYQHYVTLLSALLQDLDHLQWKRTSRDASSFYVPYRTMLRMLGKDSMSKALDTKPHESLQTAAKKLLRDSVVLFLEQLQREVDGAPFTLIPVLKFYQQCRGTKRARPQVPQPMEVGDMPSVVPPPIPTFRLESVPGAHRSLRMSPGIVDGPTMAKWIYSKLMDDGRRTMTDRQVGSWLLSACGDLAHDLTPSVVTKLLRLAVECARRPKLLVFDVDTLCSGFKCMARYKSVSRSRMSTMLMLYYWKLKDAGRVVWGEMSKDNLLYDITSHDDDLTATEWSTLTGIDPPAYVLVTTQLLLRGVAPWLFMLPGWQLALGVNALGLSYPGTRPSPPVISKNTSLERVCQTMNVGLVHKDRVIVASDGISLSAIPGRHGNIRVLFLEKKPDVWGCLVSSGDSQRMTKLLTEHQHSLPTDIRAAQTFIRTKRAPVGLSFDKNGIYLSSNPVVRLEFRWYQLTTSNVDVEQLFRDAYQILIGGGGPRTLKDGNEKRAFGEVVSSVGLLGAMHRVVDTALREHTYPDSVVPIFDMNYVPVCNQSAAFNIHRLTGRFSKHIVGYRNNAYDVQFMLNEVCIVLRRTGLIDRTRLNAAVVEANPWITPGMERRFSPKDVCLLLATVFATIEVGRPVVSTMLNGLTVHLSRTDIEDIEESTTYMTTIASMYKVASDSLVSNAHQSVCDYLEHYRVIEGPYIVYSTPDEGVEVVDEARSHAVLCGNMIGGPGGIGGLQLWFNEAEPQAVCVGIDPSLFRRWIGQQSNSRERLAPNVPCPVRIRYTGEEGVLVVFEHARDRYHVWKKSGTGGVLVELARRDFDLLENHRCLPALVKLTANGSTSYAIREDEDGVYWMASEPGAPHSDHYKLRIDVDFVWATNAYFELDLMQSHHHRNDEGPDLVPELFSEEGERMYRVLQPDMPLPGPQCQDWVMREFFSETSDYGVGRFVRWMEMKVSTAVLYEAFYAVQPEGPLNESWAMRAEQQVKHSCLWLWDRLTVTHKEHFKVVNYQKMVWFTKMLGKEHTNETFEWVMAKLYDL